MLLFHGVAWPVAEWRSTVANEENMLVNTFRGYRESKCRWAARIRHSHFL